MRFPVSRVFPILVLLLAAAGAAEARVFVLQNEKFASYLSFGYGGLETGDAVFSGESAARSYSDKFKTSLGGEFGFLSVSGPLSFRFGFEVLQPAALKGVEARNSGGAGLYEVDSRITGYLPKIGVDLNLRTTFESRIFVYGTLGQAHVSVKNSYSSLTIAPNADFETEMKGNAQSLSAGLGFEYAALDLTSVVLELGYRQLKVGKLTYAEDVTGFGGAVSAGDVVRTNTGENRSLNLSGWTAKIGARWWLF